MASSAYVYALLRILFGLLGCVFLVGLRDLATFWDPGGLVPVAAGGWKEAVIAQGLGSIAGRALFVVSLGCAVSMTIGYRSSVSVPASFMASLMQGYWNSLPLSAAFEVHSAVLFALMWADCGAVWSLDAWLARRRGFTPVEQRTSMWPIYVIRFQIALVYVSTGLWKLGSEQWRHGTALHFVLSNNAFAHFPPPPPIAAALLVIGTYLTLFWEFGFPFLVAFQRTRGIALTVGIVLHLGMWSTMELGPFSWVMLASYVSFLRPATVARAAARLTSATRPKPLTEVA